MPSTTVSYQEPGTVPQKVGRAVHRWRGVLSLVALLFLLGMVTKLYQPSEILEASVLKQEIGVRFQSEENPVDQHAVVDNIDSTDDDDKEKSDLGGVDDDGDEEHNDEDDEITNDGTGVQDSVAGDDTENGAMESDEGDPDDGEITGDDEEDGIGDDGGETDFQEEVERSKEDSDTNDDGSSSEEKANQFGDNSPSLRGKAKSDRHSTQSNGLMDYYNFCTKPTAGVPGDEENHIDIWYQCRGPNYDAFSEKLDSFVDEMYEGTYRSKKPAWGHRFEPLPANKTILLFGNSHTRQIGQTLICQMGSENIVDIERYDTDFIDPNMATRVTFRNGAKLYLVANSYAAYSPNWKRLLEKQIKVPLDIFDAIVLGRFNLAGGKVSAFLTNQLEMETHFDPKDNVNIKKNKPPTARDIADAVDVPLVISSMFGRTQAWPFREDCKAMQEIWPTRNSAFLCLDCRKYIIKMNDEGASPSKLEVSDMVISGNMLNRLHRCAGAKGGHVDLISWDVSEFLYKHLTKSKTKTMNIQL